MEKKEQKLNKNMIVHDAICAAIVYKNYETLRQKKLILKEEVEKIYFMMEEYLAWHIHPSLTIKNELQGILNTSYKTNFDAKYQKRIDKNMIVYQDGWYQCGPAIAYVIEEMIGGEKYISVSFKGTDHIKELGDYLDLKRYFIYFLPLVYSILEHAQAYHCKIKATGHSLGGTMVEYFAEECERFGLEIQGTTFGSPGSQILQLKSHLIHFKHNYDLIPRIGSLLYKPCGLVINLHTPNRKKKTFFHYTEEYVFSVLNLSDEFFEKKITSYLTNSSYLEIVAEFINVQLDIEDLINLQKIKVRRFIQKSLAKNKLKIKKEKRSIVKKIKKFNTNKKAKAKEIKKSQQEIITLEKK